MVGMPSGPLGPVLETAPEAWTIAGMTTPGQLAAPVPLPAAAAGSRRTCGRTRAFRPVPAPRAVHQLTRPGSAPAYPPCSALGEAGGGEWPEQSPSIELPGGGPWINWR